MAESIDRAVLTFCLSDLEGSTRLWESQPEAMAQALARHDELIAAAVEAQGGRFLHSMGEGDSTVSAFESVTDAVRAAIDATRALADEIARVAEAQPLDGIDNVGGPDKITFEQMARDVLAKQGDSKTVLVDPDATYFGTPLATNSLVVPA